MNPSGQTIREPRTAVEGPLSYEYGPGERGTARWRDVSRTGAGLRLGRYLRPGTVLRVTFISPVAQGGVAAMDARVMWCRQAQSGVEFEAGLRALRRDADAALAFAALGYNARKTEKGEGAPGSPLPREMNKQVWNGFGQEESGRRAAPAEPLAKAI